MRSRLLYRLQWPAEADGARETCRHIHMCRVNYEPRELWINLPNPRLLVQSLLYCMHVSRKVATKQTVLVHAASLSRVYPMERSPRMTQTAPLASMPRAIQPCNFRKYGSPCGKQVRSFRR